LDFYSANLLKQQSSGKYVYTLGHISQIPSQQVFARSSSCCVLSGEATNANFIVFGLTTIYRTRGEHANQYTIDAVQIAV
jgi:hypothetical protein